VPSVNDPNNDKTRLQKRLKDVEKLSKKEKGLVKVWISNEIGSLAESTQERYIAQLITVRNHLGIPLDWENEEGDKLREEEIEELRVPLHEAVKEEWVSSIGDLSQERDWTDGTKRNYGKAVRSFLEEVEDDVCAKKEDINLATDDSGGKIDEDDILSLQEARTLIDEASNRLRDQAMFSVLLDLGLRISALCALRVKDFDFNEGARVGEITLNDEALGQKGSGGRTHVATISSGHIRSYLRNEHPRPDEPEAPLFHKIGRHYNPDKPSDDGSVSPAMFRRRMRRLARDTDIPERKLYPHNMKHSAVTIWALRGLSDREIEYRAGWARESGQLKRYEHLTGEDINNQILDTFGIEHEDSTTTIAAIDSCPNCNVSVDTGMRYCPQCGQQIDMEMRPDWFNQYLDAHGEDDGLAEDLLDNPSQIASKPENLPESLRTRHQDKIENVVGYSLMGSASPADSDTVPVSLPYKDQPGETTVYVPFGALKEHGGDNLSVSRTNDGLLSLLDSDENVVETVDPLGVQ
jgi:integrase